MSESLPLSSSIAADLSLVLLHFLWQGALIAVVIWIVLRIGLRARPSTRYLIVLLGGLLCTLAPMATFFHLRYSVSADPINQPIVIDVAAAPLIEEAGTTDLSIVSSAADSTLPVWQFGLVVAWLLGVLLMAGRLLIGWLTVFRLRRHAVAAAPDILDRVLAYASRLRLRRIPEVAVSSRITEAMVVGMVRPMILLPAAWLTELPPDVLSAVLAHELAHVRRLDPWVNTIQRVVETLLFYHPAVWWLSRRLRIEREFCCDELAVQMTGQPLVYARTLEMVAHRQARERVPALATGIGDEKMTLLQRVQHVLGGGRENRPRSLATPLAAALVVLFAFAVYRSTLFTPASLLADDEVRRGREGQRARRGDREDDQWESRRHGRRSETRRGQHDDDAEEHEGREENHEEEIHLPENLSPEVRELINGLLSQIEELRNRLGEEGEVQVRVEVRDYDEDGDPDVAIDRRSIRLLHRAHSDGEEGGDEDGDAEVHGYYLGHDEDAERRIRLLREGEFGWRVTDIEPEHLESRDEENGEDGEEHRTEAGEARARFWRMFSEANENGELPDEAHAIFRFAPRMIEQLEVDEDGELPLRGIMRLEPRLIEEPEQRGGLEAEVQQLREQVSDLAEVVGDLRDALRERDDDESDAEHEVREERRETIRGTFRRAVEDESERHRERDEREEAGSEDEGEESAVIESSGSRRYTLRSTADGRVRVYVRELDGEESVLEGQVFEITDDRINLQGLNSLELSPSDTDEELSRDGNSDDAANPFGGGESGDEAGPFADGESDEAVDPFGDGEAGEGADPFSDDE